MPAPFPHSAAPDYDAVVVGSGPNGLAAAITLAQAGARVHVIEGKSTLGGGMRTLDLTLPGFRHDMCSAIHPLAQASAFFRALPLSEYGLEWIHPPIEIAHPLHDEDGGTAFITRSVEETAAALGDPGYARTMGPLAAHTETLLDSFLGPFSLTGTLRHPLHVAGFGVQALLSARLYARLAYTTVRGRAAFAGCAAHSLLTLDHPASAAFGLLLAMLAHHVGWAIPRGGSQAIADALVAYARTLGVTFETGRMIADLDELPTARAVVLDVTPHQLLGIAKNRLPAGYRSALRRFRYGPGVFKLDYALDGPIPWRDSRIAEAGTVHLGGTLERIAESEAALWQNRAPEHPYILLAQQSLFDATRAPAGGHTAWVYCHVPNGDPVDMRDRIERAIEAHAPGFRARVLGVAVHNAPAMQAYSPNYVGGDVNGGVQDLFQLFTRPLPQLDPYRTPLHGVYLCSSSTPPGGGVHGMCGMWAARSVLKRL
jgi:phytoene dehydrogenase-like protein